MSISTYPALVDNTAVHLGNTEVISGAKQFTGIGGGNQIAPAGIYPLIGSGLPGIEFADGTTNWRIDNNLGTLRFLKAGISTVTTLDLTGQLITDSAAFSKISVGAASSSLRSPFPATLTIDGSTFTAGTSHADKVAQALVVTFKGGFSGEASVTPALANPAFVFGANDFIVTGTVSGDIAGLTDMIGRLTEVHLQTPNAGLTTLTAMQVESTLEVSAAGSTTGTLKALNVIPRIRGGTVTNAYGVYISASALSGTGTITGINESLHVDGKTTLNGDVSIPNGAALTVTGNTAGKFARFSSFTPNVQAVTAGVYLGLGNGTDPSFELSTGVDTGRIDVVSGALRFLKAGVQVIGSWDLTSSALTVNGALTATGALSIGGTTGTTATAGAASALPSVPVGYVTVTIGGVARKIPYYA